MQQPRASRTVNIACARSRPMSSPHDYGDTEFEDDFDDELDEYGEE